MVSAASSALQQKDKLMKTWCVLIHLICWIWTIRLLSPLRRQDDHERLLKDAQNEAYFKSWYQKLLAALQFCVGKALNDEISKEKKLIRILRDIGEKVKSASDSQRQEILRKEVGRLDEFFQDTNTCHLPLNPALCIKGIDRNACSYFTSNALPLKITFINANPLGTNISVIFKAGDDLRQDMLVLQVIQVMDNIWLQEGLDMQMIIYRCLSTGKNQGLVQMVPDAVTLAKIHRHSGLIGPLKENTIKKWFSQHNHAKADYEKETEVSVFEFPASGSSGVSTVNLFAQLPLLQQSSQRRCLLKLLQDRAPFIFTSEMEYFITEGGKNPQHFQDFVELCCRAYNIVRKHSRLLLNLLEMNEPNKFDFTQIYSISSLLLDFVGVKMLHAGLPELRGIQDLKYVYNNLRPQDTDLEATSHFTKKIKESLECFPVKLNNLIHILAQMSAVNPTKSPPMSSRNSCVLSTAGSVQRATILGFSKNPSESFPSLVFIPPGSTAAKSWSPSRRLTDKTAARLQSEEAITVGEKSADKNPKVQLVISHEEAKLTILVKHMKNIHLPDGSAPSAHVEFYLLPSPSEVRRRKTKSVPKCTDPTYNEIVVYDEVAELRGHVLMLIVKSKTVFVGAINIQLCSVLLNEEKWFLTWEKAEGILLFWANIFWQPEDGPSVLGEPTGRSAMLQQTTAHLKQIYLQPIDEVFYGS
ncbi:Phosphatidylinositol-4-phosphate 3-kinase C2 domain-containing subunit gamma [Fukomys damarensis]|uniref:Phosphatidylinositol-4-phosphate 3-kinase C2 domain-containing subunit gamma n=1 Tax=Fukomys damarensis TaxID=885580 RepID=A0A091E205_FUKDA|nr:Phosphatidylinositol-4-phosphate 3-kinase C2 domain-containing subunit gamma [Fukomys damarensis]